jgi:Plasmid pRiA4b ORF-3-like protein
MLTTTASGADPATAAIMPVAYQLRVVLRGISPLIWRRLLVRSDSSIADLHYTLQLAMGWTDTHLHCFHIHGKDYGVGHSGGMSFADDPHGVRSESVNKSGVATVES